VKLKKINLLHLLPEYKEGLKDVSLNNSWLLGYIDSRVLFYGRWHKSKKLLNKEGKEIYLCCIFWHLDKELLYKIRSILNLKNNVEFKSKWNLPFYKLILDQLDEKIIISTYLKKFKLKSAKKNRYKYWNILLKYETLYKNTGFLDFNKIEKILIKLSSTINEDELNKI
jgi:hypothetical protein